MNDELKTDATCPIISADSLFKTYYEGSVETPVLKGCSLTVNKGEFVAITGASGAGKSTLLHLLGLLDTPDEGVVSYSGRDISKLNEAERASVRNREFGFVFQAYHLINELDAQENVLLPAMMLPRKEYFDKRAEYKEHAAKLLDRIGMGERLKHRPLQLSGGERQRVAIARAMMNSPKVLFCDEPTGNLDEKSSRTVFDLLLKLREEEGLTLVLVTHERPYAEAADHVYRIHNGRAEKEK
jgi:lipoprotein-releasing system ATP-binding protein